MRKLLNTLYVTTPEAYLTKDGENVVIRVKEKDIFRIPVLNIEGIVTFGYMGASPALMKMCGIEGEAATTYFSVFDQMIISQCEDFPFNGRNRRPPKDKVNALLSFVYTLLNHEVQSALETVGLDPYVGFLHTDRPGRASLALDMMEELRAYLADRLVLSLINRKQISGKGFVEHGDNGIVMDEDIRKEVLLAWQKRKKETIIHPYLNESVPIGLIPYIQAMLLARFLRNDLDNYPVFLMK